MAEKDEAPKFNPRHRILGAIIVVALAVIVVPMILEESEPPSELKGVTGIPSRGGATQVVVTPVAELGVKDAASAKEKPAVAAVAPPAAEPPAVQAGKPAVEKPVVQELPRVTVSEPVGEKPASPKPPVEKAAAKSDKPAKGWMVQVGVYSNPDNAARVRDKLRALDLDVTEDRITLKGEKMVRLRVGPYRERAAADKALARLEKDAGIKAVVRAYP